MADYDSPAPGQSSGGNDQTLGCYKSYAISVPGIIKIVEIVLSLVCFICASINSIWILPQFGGGFVQFTSIVAVIICSVLFLFRVSNLISRIPGPIPFIEFIIYIVLGLCYLISGILSAVQAGKVWYVYINGNKDVHSSAPIGAAAFFAFACLIVFIVDTIFTFMEWRSGSRNPPPVQAQRSPEAGLDEPQDEFSKY